MRLIDADKLQPDRMTNRGTVAISQSQIANAPTVCDIEQIRAGIADLDDAEYEFEGYYKAVNDALQIIDKYR